MYEDYIHDFIEYDLNVIYQELCYNHVLYLLSKSFADDHFNSHTSNCV